MRKHKRRRHANRRIASRSGLGDAFYNILTVAALGLAGYTAYKAYQYDTASAGPGLSGPLR